MPRNTIKFALRISPETQQLVKELCPRDNCQSQNEFIERAIRFYAGYVSGKEAIEYLPPALVAAMRGMIHDSEQHIASLLFKLAVEMDMVMNICHDIVVLNFGKVVAHGTPGDVSNNPAVIEAYLGTEKFED